MTILKYLHFQNVENEILKDNNKNLTKIKSSSKTWFLCIEKQKDKRKVYPALKN